MEITINDDRVSVTMDNGKTLQVPSDYLSIETIDDGDWWDLIIFADGGEWWFTDYRRDRIDGLDDELADGETFAASDGCSWTRYGAEVLAIAPGRR
jgi:hypothetical protein